jgi:diaminohydroxyphosphoribosylaminopyrimidine deaminase/5-amino-6-(5-phosphoribosylamino)uracil reductase
VLVRDGEVLGEGFTQPAGGDHAEVVALRRAGEAAARATAYVTLEPCCHHGRTPPCTDALLAPV